MKSKSPINNAKEGPMVVKSNNDDPNVIEQIQEFIRRTLSAKMSDLQKLFKSCEVQVTDDECSAFHQNMSKNRYPNIPCLDRTRFKIDDDSSYYIHANKISICSELRFICTQAPEESTIDDFWRMVVDSETDRIVMLCNFFENGTEKCAKYFPDVESFLELPSCTVMTETLTDVSKEWSTGFDHVLKRQLKVSSKTRNKEVTISHFQYNSWEDHGIPETFDITLRLLELVRRGKKPTLVHCSAGVGRTGTFVFIESMISALRNPNQHHVDQSLALLRRDRAKMVQTFPQYVFSVRCVLEHLFREGFMRDEERLQQFDDKYNKLMQKMKEKNSKLNGKVVE